MAYLNNNGVYGSYETEKKSKFNLAKWFTSKAFWITTLITFFVLLIIYIALSSVYANAVVNYSSTELQALASAGSATTATTTDYSTLTSYLPLPAGYTSGAYNAGYSYSYFLDGGSNLQKFWTYWYGSEVYNLYSQIYNASLTTSTTTSTISVQQLYNAAINTLNSWNAGCQANAAFFYITAIVLPIIGVLWIASGAAYLLNRKSNKVNSSASNLTPVDNSNQELVSNSKVETDPLSEEKTTSKKKSKK